jgi:hypothetical membrane protein
LIEFFLQYYTFISVAYIAAIAALAHLNTPEEYHWRSNTISELAAQGYDRKWVMQIGLIGFGILLGIGSAVKMLQFQVDWFTEMPLIIYAGLVLASGVFSTRPFLKTEKYSKRDDRIHSFSAQIGGVFFTSSILLKSLASESLGAAAPHILFLLLVTLTAMIYGRTGPSMKGVAQRTMWVVSFIWLAFLA